MHEPTQELYLNEIALSFLKTPLTHEPTQELYLNKGTITMLSAPGA